jgi:MFS family permease/acetolactate synthase regulatory subunit
MKDNKQPGAFKFINSFPVKAGIPPYPFSFRTHILLMRNELCEEWSFVSVHAISLLVNNSPGVLARVSELFARSGYNIENVRVRKFKEPAFAKIKLISAIDNSSINQVVTQLSSLLDVIQVKAEYRKPLWERSSLWRGLSQSATLLHPRIHQHALLRKLAYWFVALGLFMTVFGTNLPSPLYAIYREQWQLSANWITSIFATYALIVIPTIVVAGQLSDRFGRKWLLIVGVFMSLLGSLSFSLATSPFHLLIARILQGISIGMLNGVAVAALTELDKNNSRSKAALAAAIAVTSGNALGPLLSGLLGDYAPYPTKLAFYFHVMIILPCLLGLFYLREKSKLSLDVISIRFPRVPKSVRRTFILTSLTSFLAWAVMSMVMSILPSYLNQWIPVTTLWMSGALIALVFTLSTCSQLLLRKSSILLSLALGFVCLITGLVGFTIAVYLQSIICMLISVILIGIGHGPAYSSTLARLNERIDEEGRSDVVSAYYVFTYLGVSVPILGMGIAASRIGLFPSIMAFTSIMVVLMTAGLFIWIRNERSGS